MSSMPEMTGRGPGLSGMGELAPALGNPHADAACARRLLSRSGPRGFDVIPGSERVATMQAALARLAQRTGQASAAAQMPHTLRPCRLKARVPHLLVRRAENGELESAVVLHQYAIRGVPTGCFVPVDTAGEQNVFAPVEARRRIALEAAAFLLRRRAVMVFLSLAAAGDSHTLDEFPILPFRRVAQTRTLIETLALGPTLDATLASMGAHTRRNLRYYRRRAVAELGATFHAQAEISEADFVAMNRHTLYPAPESTALCRYRTARELAGSFMIGLRAGDGRWLSLVGGRRCLGATTVDWQMNAEGFAGFSLGTAIRAFLLEDEIARGTRMLRFEKGTPHTMRRSFVEERVDDVLMLRRLVPLGLLRRVIPPRLAEGDPLSAILLSRSLAWRAAGR